MEQYDFYKDSGVEWIGEIPEHWEVKRLKDVADINAETLSEKTPADYEFSYVDIGCVNSGGKISDVQQYTFAQAPSRARRIVKKDDVIVSTVRTYLRAIAYIDDKYKEAIVSTGFAVVSAEKRLAYPRYLYYQITNEPFIQSIVSKSLGVSYPAINSEIFAALHVFLPPTSEQKAIVSYLDDHTQKLDRLIKNKKKQITRLQELRQIEINKAVTKGLNPDVFLKDSGVEWLGQIPEHWEVKRLKSVTELIIDATHFTPTYVETGVPFLRVTDIQTEEINFDEIKYIPEVEHEELCRRSKAQRGDLLLSKNGTIGLMKIVDWDWEFSFFVSLCLIRFKSEVSPYYFKYFFRSKVVDEQLKASSKTTSVTNLHLDKINLLKIAFPEVDEQESIVEFLDERIGKIETAISNLETQISQLQEVRKIEIFNAVTGKVKVPARYFEQQEAEALA